jgi:hypothetical protein
MQGFIQIFQEKETVVITRMQKPLQNEMAALDAIIEIELRLNHFDSASLFGLPLDTVLGLLK